MRKDKVGRHQFPRLHPSEPSMTDKQIDEACRFLSILVNACKYRTDDICV